MEDVEDVESCSKKCGNFFFNYLLITGFLCSLISPLTTAVGGLMLGVTTSREFKEENNNSARVMWIVMSVIVAGVPLLISFIFSIAIIIYYKCFLKELKAEYTTLS